MGKMMFRLSPREMRRLMKRMGLNLEELSGVSRVIVEFDNGKKLVAESPIAYLIRGKDQTMLQVIGSFEEVREEKESIEAVEINEEDVQLVAAQTGVSLEEAKQALIQTNGDIAQAIMLIEARKRKTV